MTLSAGLGFRSVSETRKKGGGEGETEREEGEERCLFQVTVGS